MDDPRPTAPPRHAAPPPGPPPPPPPPPNPPPPLSWFFVSAASAAHSRRVGVWLAGLFGVYPSLLGFNTLLLTEVQFTFLLCGFCSSLARALRRESYAMLGLAGLLLGLAALTRSVLWLFPPVLS